MEGITYRIIKAADYDQLYHLWSSSPGVGLSGADTRESIRWYLAKNRMSSFAAFSKERLVGSVLAGDDGRRGYLHHLVVHPDFRRMGIGRKLVGKAVKQLKNRKIEKSHIFIFSDNQEGVSFWKGIGWHFREDIAIMSFSMTEKDRMSEPDIPRTC